MATINLYRSRKVELRSDDVELAIREARAISWHLASDWTRQKLDKLTQSSAKMMEGLVPEKNLERWLIAQRKEASYWTRTGIFATQDRRVTERYQPVLQALGEEWCPTGGRILEVGSGPTFAGRHIRGAEHYFLDPLMEVYKRIYRGRMAGGQRIAGVGEKLPFEDGEFDVVVTCNALDHFADPGLALTEISRVVRKGGSILIFVFLHSPFVERLRRFADRNLPFFAEDAHPHSFSRDSLRMSLESKFDVIEARCVFKKERVFFSAWHREDWFFLCRSRID